MGTEYRAAPGFTPVISPWMSRARTSPNKSASAGSSSPRLRSWDSSSSPSSLSRLKPAVPSVDRSTVWIDTVKRGPMVRQVRGLGTLVPVEIRWIAANTEGRVEKIVVWPGTQWSRTPSFWNLTSPELEQAAGDAESKAKAAEAELTTLRATLQRELLDQESTTARVHSEYEQAKMEAETNDQLAKNGLVSDLVYKTSKVKGGTGQPRRD